MRIVIVVKRQTDLLEIVGALHSPSCFTRGLNGRQKKPNEHSNDCDDDKKLNEREGRTRPETIGTHGGGLRKRETELCSHRPSGANPRTMNDNGRLNRHSFDHSHQTGSRKNKDFF